MRVSIPKRNDIVWFLEHTLPNERGEIKAPPTAAVPSVLINLLEQYVTWCINRIDPEAADGTTLSVDQNSIQQRRKLLESNEQNGKSHLSNMMMTVIRDGLSALSGEFAQPEGRNRGVWFLFASVRHDGRTKPAWTPETEVTFQKSSIDQNTKKEIMGKWFTVKLRDLLDLDTSADRLVTSLGCVLRTSSSEGDAFRMKDVALPIRQMRDWILPRWEVARERTLQMAHQVARTIRGEEEEVPEPAQGAAEQVVAAPPKTQPQYVTLLCDCGAARSLLEKVDREEMMRKKKNPDSPDSIPSLPERQWDSSDSGGKGCSCVIIVELHHADPQVLERQKVVAQLDAEEKQATKRERARAFWGALGGLSALAAGGSYLLHRHRAARIPLSRRQARQRALRARGS